MPPPRKQKLISIELRIFALFMLFHTLWGQFFFQNITLKFLLMPVDWSLGLAFLNRKSHGKSEKFMESQNLFLKICVETLTQNQHKPYQCGCLSFLQFQKKTRRLWGNNSSNTNECLSWELIFMVCRKSVYLNSALLIQNHFTIEHCDFALKSHICSIHFRDGGERRMGEVVSKSKSCTNRFESR